MEITVLKCDRCKKEVDGLIEFSFINRNVKLDDDDGEKPGAFDLWMGLSKRCTYPTVEGGLCLDCVEEIGRWLGHEENILSEAVK